MACTVREAAQARGVGAMEVSAAGEARESHKEVQPLMPVLVVACAAVFDGRLARVAVIHHTFPGARLEKEAWGLVRSSEKSPLWMVGP